MHKKNDNEEFIQPNITHYHNFIVIQRHNEVRDALGDLASLVYKDVIGEPIVQEANDACGIPSLVADLSIRGVWQSQTVTLFDIRVIDTDAPSYLHRDVASVHRQLKKKRRGNTMMQQKHGVLHLHH